MIRRDRNESGLILDTLAGLASAKLSLDQSAKASDYVSEILANVAENGVTGIEFPVQVYLICYKVLEACGQGTFEYQSKAAGVLKEGYALLHERMALIQDIEYQHRFLHNIPFNRKLHELWLAAGHST